ncbi:hypothetical protein PRZ48_014823 [Zasmidium cellare]|uniref:Uncharacterized protein n=1 Tax=Zasmidium cellare TaxID=395010 RepID=A0ABR0DZF8_ZASCE|nr:hypothetical protein PRZ48_014823 [Zasmidium cellare]
MPRRIPSRPITCCRKIRPDERLFECRGPEHPGPTLTHRCCATIPDEGEEFLCDPCLLEKEVAQPFTQQTAYEHGSSQEEEDLDPASEGYGPVVDSRINDLKGDRMEYLLTKPGRQLETWLPATHIPDHVLQEFEAGFLGVSHSQDQTDAFHLPLDLDDASDAANEAADNRFWEFLKVGYRSLADATYDECCNNHSALRNMPGRDIYRIECVSILASMPHKALVAILGSGLTKQKLTDEELRSNLRELRKRSVGQPNCYHIEFCDVRGIGPTLREMREFADVAEQYAWPTCEEDANIAIEIDSVKNSLSKAEEEEIRNTNKRRYLSPGEKDNTRKNLRILLDKLRMHLSGLTIGDDDPVPFLLDDVGYTDNAPRRLEKDHSQHSGSNDLMNLFEAISIVCAEGKYRMRADVIFVCCKKVQAYFSEILFSVLAESYIWTGKGFNGRPAGENRGTLDKYDSEEQWAKWRQQQLDQTPFKENMRNEALRAAKYEDELEDLDDQAAEGEEEIQEHARIEFEGLMQQTQLRDRLARAKEYAQRSREGLEVQG